MMDEAPVRWDRAIQVVKSVYPPLGKPMERCGATRRLGFEEAKRAIVAALEAEQKREWDRRLIKTT
jgi:hypothetical protein